MQINDEQKRIIIEKAQSLYREGFDVRCKKDPFAQEVDIATFKEACHDMSCLVHYLAQEMYNVPNEENEIFHCEFRYQDAVWSHYFNKICGRIVDSTIMQFENMSPYDDHDDCYTKLEKVEYSNAPIEFEIQLFESQQYLRNSLDRKKRITYKTSLFEKFVHFFVINHTNR